MRQKKRVLAIIFVVLTIALSGGVCVVKNEDWTQVSNLEEQKFSIVIDAGHGGFDGGAVAKDGTVEKDINLKIALELEKILKSYPVEVTMIRRQDVSLCEDEDADNTKKIRGKKTEDIHRRKDIIEASNADLTISIHLNSYPNDALVYGAQVFYPSYEQKRTNKDKCEQLSKMYAENVQKSLEINIDDGRERVAMAKGDTYLLRNATSPFILVECGFLSNADECERLKTADYQRLIATSIWQGINTSLGLEKEQKIQIIQSANKG